MAESFDTAHARATADACERAAARLAAVRREQASDAAVAAEGWRGPHRDRFDLRLAHTTRRSLRLEGALRALAAALRAAADQHANRPGPEPGPVRV